ncbi:MAG TPA: GMC family oxidoreductase [Bryobacteraceae bacterium]|nr:GMC family oxidoreductase [Bryobacteraceae bacterium]
MTQDYDVVIIGSGAAGGMAAYTLCKAGVKCLMLEAGPMIDFQRHRTMKAVYDLPYRGFGEPGRFPHITQASEFDANVWIDEKKNPYSYPEEDPFYWVRIRMMGGKTLRWGRASWRLSNFEFKGKDHDGFGENWPVTLEDLAPFYDRVEPLFRVSGRNEGWPQMPDGKIMADESRDSLSIQRFKASAAKLGVPTTKPRRATGTLASSVNLLLPDALATGNLTIVPHAVVREIGIDNGTGRVNAVHFVDRRNKRDYSVPVKMLMLGASTLESTRLLLNSRSRLFPNGLANSSGVLGHYLFDQFYVKNTVVAVVPEARGGKGGRTLMGGGGYIPRFRNLKGKEKNFIRGYAYDFGSGGSPSPEILPAYGSDLLKMMDELQGSTFSMTTMGEGLPRYENKVSIHPTLKDAWGIPSLHIQQKYTDNEFNMAKDAMETGAAACEGAGFEVLAKHWEMVPPGESIHELGTCRMGADPKKSVLNGWNQAHDVKNLFVLDGSSFVSGGVQNPTLTILALTVRASEYMMEQKKKGQL